MSRLVDADVVTARLQECADGAAGIMHGSPRGTRNRDIALGKTAAYESAIRIVRDATTEGAPVEASTGEAEPAMITSGSISDGGSIGAVDVEGAPTSPPYMDPCAGTGWWLCRRCNYSMLHPALAPAPLCPECSQVAPIRLDVSHGVEPHTSGVGVAVSEFDCREASAGTAPDLRSDTAESPAAPPPGALEGVGAPASPDPTDFLEAQEVVSGALLKAHRLAVWRDEALPLLDQWLDLAHDARDAGLIHVPYGQSVTQAFARWARQHIDHEGDQP